MKLFAVVAMVAMAATSCNKDNGGDGDEPEDETGGFYLEKKASIGTNVMNAPQGLVLGGDIYYIDKGMDNYIPKNVDMWAYNVAGNSWAQKTPAPINYQHDYTFENKIYTIKQNTYMYQYSPETDEWTDFSHQAAYATLPKYDGSYPVTIGGTTYLDEASVVADDCKRVLRIRGEWR